VCARENRVAAAEHLLRVGASVDPFTVDADTPLFVAARHGATAMLEVLLAHQANTNHRNKKGWTAAMVAAAAGHVACLQVLLSHNAALTDASAPGGRTPLFEAVSARQEATVRSLIQRGASTQCADSNGRNVLTMSVCDNMIDMLQLLLALKCVDVEHLDESGSTPLLHACLRRNLPAVQLLLTAVRFHAGERPVQLCVTEPPWRATRS
jgi:ankyrin repeat protein